MKKVTNFALTALLIIVFSSCGSTTKIISSQSPNNLSGKKINLQLLSSSGAISVYLGALSSSSSAIAGGSVMNGEKQAEIAARNLAFELRSLGFILTNSAEDSDVTANFSIGTVSYDPLVGWIADQSFLEFYDKNGQHILTVRAKTRFITPTVENMIKSLIKELSHNI